MSEYPLIDFVKQRPFVPATDPSDNENYEHESMITPAAATVVYIPENILGILAQALDENIRFTLTGTAPTTTTGFRLSAGDPPVWIDTPNGLVLTIIGEGGGGGGTFEYEFGA